MKRLIAIFPFSLAICTSCFSQTITSRYRPMSWGDMLLQVQAEAVQAESRREKFNEYKNLAYSNLEKKDYNAFLYYSQCALNCGYYTPSLYYDRGKAFEYFNEYKKAKKEYKKAIKYGHYPAVQALEECKVNEWRWKKSH